MVRKDATGPREETGRHKNMSDQMSRLAHRLRDEGIAPERDLWADIDEAITAAERNRIRPARKPQRHGLRSLTAVAAVLALAAFGWWGQQLGPEPADLSGGAAGVAAVAGEVSSLETIDQALDQLNLALAGDPDNLSLTSLSLMLHKSRGRILRQHADARCRSI